MIINFLVVLCLFQVVVQSSTNNPGINPGEIAELNYIFRETPYDSALLETYASYLISRHGIDDGLVNSTAAQIYKDLFGILTQFSVGSNSSQVQKLMQNISNQLKIVFRVLKQQGIQEETILALWIPLAYNDMINVLSVHANKLDRTKLSVINFGNPKFPSIIAKKSNITARNEFLTALAKARNDMNSLKLYFPKLIIGINQQQISIYNNFKDLMVKLGNSAYNIAAVSKKSYANAIKALIEDASKQAETILKIFSNNGVKEDLVVFEIVVKIFTDMMTDLMFFQTAL